MSNDEEVLAAKFEVKIKFNNWGKEIDHDFQEFLFQNLFGGSNVIGDEQQGCYLIDLEKIEISSFKIQKNSNQELQDVVTDRIDLALKINKFIHDRCKDAPRDIGINILNAFF